MSSTAVARIPAPALADFERDWLLPCRPVVIAGALEASRARRKWSPAYLAALLHGATVKVVVSDDGLSATIPGQPQRWQVVELPFETATRLCQHPDPPGRKFFVMQKTISRKMSLLALDLERPPWVPADQALSNNFWMGSEGVITPLHFDVANNLLAVFAGSKQVTLFAPADSEYLDPMRDWDARHPNRSRIDLDSPSALHQQGLARAHPIRVTLGPGDLLYLPPLWWHHVRSEGVSISVNFWWKPRLGQCLGPTGRAMLRAEWARDRFASLAERVDLGPGQDRRVAAAAIAAEAPGIAKLIAASAGVEVPEDLLARAAASDAEVGEDEPPVQLQEPDLRGPDGRTDRAGPCGSTG